MSRIWGGIHPPFDDMYGRVAGETAGIQAHQLAKSFFAGAPLSIQLVSFNQSVSDCMVRLDWETATEEQSSHFELWHSEDGMNYDNKIGEIRAAGNSNTIKKYSFSYRAKKANNYFKLIEKDLNGKVSSTAFSPMVTVDCFTQPAFITVFPNPSFNEINIRISSDNDALDKVEICDLSGRIIKNKIFGNDQTQQSKLTLQDINPGNYKLIIQTTEGLKEVKLFEKK